MKMVPVYISLLLFPLNTLAQDSSISLGSNENFGINTLAYLGNQASIDIRDSVFSKQTFGRKAYRAAKLILVGEIATMAFFYAMPESFSNWNKNFYKTPVVNWKRAFTMPPKWDDDPIMVNYIQHPLGGAIYYNGVRSQGATKLQSFLFSVAESTFFEYFIESVAERPSTQDLIVTPVAGCLIGELENKLTLRMKRHGFSFAEKVIVFLINPMYVVFNGYKKDISYNTWTRY